MVHLPQFHNVQRIGGDAEAWVHAALWIPVACLAVSLMLDTLP